MTDHLSEAEKERIRARFYRLATALGIWGIIFIIFTIIWYGTGLGDGYNAYIYFGIFMSTWFFGMLLTVGYVLDVETTDKVLYKRKKAH